MNDFNSVLGRFLGLISLVALIISTIGLFIFLKTVFFCVKRYIYSSLGIDVNLSLITMESFSEKKELSPDEIVRKNILKDKIDNFARDTANIVKSNNYLTERKEDSVDDEYKKEMKILSKIYISLAKMPINNSDELDEVEFLFNNGKLRNNSEIELFYKNRDKSKKEEKYAKSGFFKDIYRNYHEAEISSKLTIGLSLMFISGMFFIYRLYFGTYEFQSWSYSDAGKFILGVITTVFDPYYDGSDKFNLFHWEYDMLSFSMSLILSTLISFLVGNGTSIVIRWVTNSNAKNIYKKAGLKKKPDIILGVNTASYLYVLHKLLKKRS